MNALEVLEICREAIFVLLKMSAPVMLIGLGVGLLIGLFQALTQIQEMTLTFVPKILAIFISLIIFMPFMYNLLVDFTEGIEDKIINIEALESGALDEDNLSRQP
jgi:flagellar biosynthetic protein FliQ